MRTPSEIKDLARSLCPDPADLADALDMSREATSLSRALSERADALGKLAASARMPSLAEEFFEIMSRHRQAVELRHWERDSYSKDLGMEIYSMDESGQRLVWESEDDKGPNPLFFAKFQEIFDFFQSIDSQPRSLIPGHIDCSTPESMGIDFLGEAGWARLVRARLHAAAGPGQAARGKPARV